MDPISVAIVAAVAAGIAKVGPEAIADAYHGLKALIIRKYGADSKVAKAVDEVEANPESKSRPAVLSEEIVAAKADQDQELLAVAKALLEQIKAQPGGTQIVQTATGNYIAQAAGNSTATVNVNVPKS